MKLTGRYRGMKKKTKLFLSAVSFFTIAIITTVAFGQNMGTINVGGSRFGNINYQGESHQFTLYINSPGTYTIDLISPSGRLDCYLNINGPNMNMTNDDGGQGLNSRIISYFQPGNYTINAQGLGSSTGDYNLTVNMGGVSPNVSDQGGQPGPSSGRPISFGQSANDSIQYTGERDEYSFSVSNPGQVTITMNATYDGLDTYLELHDSYGNQISTDDDGGQGLNSCLSQYLQPGNYRIVARSFGSSTGGYTLRLNYGGGCYSGNGGNGGGY